MSYTEICDKFENIVLHVREGAQTVQTVSSVFKQLKKASDIYYQTLTKLEQMLNVEGSKRNLDTLGMALSSMKENIRSMSEHVSLQFEITEPLDLFLEHYISTNNEIVNQGMWVFRNLEKHKDKMYKNRETYFLKSEKADKAEAQSLHSESKERQERYAKQSMQQRQQAAKASEVYMESFSYVNKLWEDYESKMPTLLEGLQQSEESRIHFMKYSLEKFARTQGKMGSSIQCIGTELAQIVSNINSNIDIRLFVDSNRLKSQAVLRESFVTYEEWKRQKQEKSENSFREDDYEVLEEPPGDPDRLLISSVIRNLIPHHYRGDSSEDSADEIEFDQSSYTKLTQLLQTPDGRGLFCECLEYFKGPTHLSEYSITQLAALFTSLLTSMVMDSDDDPIVFYKSIILSQIFYTYVDNKKRYLNYYIANHNVWQDKTRWLLTIQWAVQNKVDADREWLNRTNPPKKKRGLFGAIKSFANKFPAFQKELTGGEQAERSSAFMVMSQFNFHMINLGLQIDVASEIALNCANRCKLDIERTCVLLAELQANQRSIRQPMRNGRRRQSSLKKREKERLKWGNELLGIGMTLPYLTPEEAWGLLNVSKYWRALLFRDVSRKMLFEVEEKTGIRTVIWSELLRTGNIQVQYSEILEKVTQNSSILGELREIINMDVARSYQRHPHITSENLRNILRTFAFYNPNVGYCQGMNYVAGTLYINLQDEELAFKCLVGLIEKYDMTTLFTKNLPKLKLLFYQLDRIIGILLPDLHEQFKEEMISSSHFTSSWFITLFGSTLQNKMEILSGIWDMFIIVICKQDGWKVIFKAAIAILEYIADDLTNKRFEDIMAILTNVQGLEGIYEQGKLVGSTGFWQSSFFERMRNVKVTNSLLKDLESEYEHLKLRASMIFEQ